MQNSNPEDRREINLNQLAQNFMRGMQRHFDMLAFNLASRKRITEQDYQKMVHAVGLMPLAGQHQNFEQTQAYARDLLHKQLVNDALTLAISILHNTHFFLAIVKCTEGNPEKAKEKQAVAEGMQKAFVEGPLDHKFNRLEDDYGIRCELEDTITSLGFCLQALAQNNGMVIKNYLDQVGELRLELKSLGSGVQNPLSNQTSPKLVEYIKVFREGDYVSFNDKELQLILVTVATFADNLFKSISDYAKSMRSDGLN
ncbi:MAG: Uncharacterised protein [Opitutia bacterium UBA7350]|nr:MAG: Uncharacterised protein [Opitutae bacterium UBA7350]